MRLIVVGCEYAGVTTLIDGLYAWGNDREIHYHLDDHFTIPDAYHLDTEEQKGMLGMLPAIKERFQRFQLVYHIRLLHKFDHILMGGFHIEEMVYGPRYYYPGINIHIREYEPDMPKNVILTHLYARPEVIRSRMKAHPHPFPLVPSEEVSEILQRFEEEVAQSWIHRKFAIDTSDLTPSQLLDTFLEQSVPYLNTRDMLTRMHSM
tara:strand:- start:8 stop:625 length:618 start_codon:yes stop_codon:yes gene_type:complete